MENSYDKIPYAGRAHQQTHIEKIASIAFLFQVPFPPIETARVLELGCGDGSNIINMAYSLPKAQFLGFDASSVQIERGRETIQNIALSNVTLHHCDLLDSPSELGLFDYIICHGVFSWVAPVVQDKILSICRAHLQPNGIGYISYNALPGWHMYDALRKMMQYHVRNIDDESKKIEQAIAMLQFVSQHVPDPYSSYGSFVRSNTSKLSASTGEYIFHEYLEEHNQAFYFHEFIEKIKGHSLQYLGDTHFNTMNNLQYPDYTQKVLNELSPNIFALEQYMDFLRFRRFRCSLITHDNKEISREVDLSPFTQVYYSLHPNKDPNKVWKKPTEEEIEELLENTFIPVEDTSAKNIPLYSIPIRTLCERWPGYLHFDDLIQKTEEKQQQNLSVSEKANVAALLQTLFLKEIVEIHLFSPPIACEISQRPLLSPVARQQILYQHSICTLHHTTLYIQEPWMHELLPLLDGTRTIPELIDELWQRYQSGRCLSLFGEKEEPSRKGTRYKVDDLLSLLLCNATLIQ
ncbi:MAG: class I SAM-dependent methyltransferase [Myxococcota bacterium]|nr:class I SAM-dependent methyltransferase [Myxococcota bacterium]